MSVFLPCRDDDLWEQSAVALAAAKRGTGERERLVESDAPVEEFVIRGRRILVKRDDKVPNVLQLQLQQKKTFVLFFT